VRIHHFGEAHQQHKRSILQNMKHAGWGGVSAWMQLTFKAAPAAVLWMQIGWFDADGRAGMHLQSEDDQAHSCHLRL
tara:strand:- start:554 stop:784 length:231 start_codon:yes stop_codon:yes gene_type:complete